MTISNTGVTNIAADAVGSAEIAADAVGSSEIATDAVGSAEIAAGAVGTSEAPDFVNSTVENLKVIRGAFGTTTPSVQSGSGFTLTRNAAGDVTVNFSASFSANPSVTATAVTLGAGVSLQALPSASSARFQAFNTTTAAAVETNVCFIAIGPR